MEVMIFCTTIGLLMAGTFVLIGVCIGKADDYYHQKHAKDNRADVRSLDNNNPVLHSGTCDSGDSSLGDIHGKEPCRCNMGSSRVKRLSNEDLGAFIRIFIHTDIRLSAGETEYLLEIADRLEGEYETND